MPDQPSPPLRRVVVLAGGGSRRLGRDKLSADLGDRTVLGALLDGLRVVAPDAQVVVVGPPERATAGALVVQEDPPGGGPVAGLAAGLAAELAAPTLADDDLVAVLAGDQPFAAAALPMLTATLARTPNEPARNLAGAIGVDPDGRDQPLLAVYRTAALRRALGGLAVGPGVTGARVRDLIANLHLAHVPLPDTATLDVDTAHDLERALAVVRREADVRRP